MSTKDYSHPAAGTKFGRLTVQSCYLRDCGTYKKTCVLAVCDCGNNVDVFLNSLKKGQTQSCGCYQKVRASESNLTHGQTRSNPLYRVWATMISRCHNPNVKSYKDYGAKGITVCLLWKASFEEFHNWAVTNQYAGGLEIDRIDNSQGYCPENCRWVTRTVNANNKTTSRFLEYMGKRQTVSHWSDELGIRYTTIIKRLKLGWSVEKALSTP